MAALILAIQSFGVMPLLNLPTDAVVQGKAAEGFPWHLAYILLETIKIALLLIVAFPKRETKDGTDQARV